MNAKEEIKKFCETLTLPIPSENAKASVNVLLTASLNDPRAMFMSLLEIVQERTGGKYSSFVQGLIGGVCLANLAENPEALKLLQEFNELIVLRTPELEKRISEAKEESKIEELFKFMSPGSSVIQ